jgi:hypothetical protein
LLLVAAIAIAADGGDRDKLVGAWESHDGETWMISENGDAFHITRSQNGHKVADFECNTAGRECDVKESGKPAKISMWFNGPKLVVMETRGSEVVKRRLQAVSDGKEMEIETMPIVPEGKTETSRLTRSVSAQQ